MLGLERKKINNLIFAFPIVFILIMILFLSYFSFLSISFNLIFLIQFCFVLWLRVTLFFFSRNNTGLVEERNFLISFFLFIIEFLRIIIRPLTLTLRISVNLVLGEIFGFLLGRLIFFPKIRILACLFEFFVIIVQRVILISLLTSYFNFL